MSGRPFMPLCCGALTFCHLIKRHVGRLMVGSLDSFPRALFQSDLSLTLMYNCVCRPSQSQRQLFLGAAATGRRAAGRFASASGDSELLSSPTGPSSHLWKPAVIALLHVHCSFPLIRPDMCAIQCELLSHNELWQYGTACHPVKKRLD